MSDDEAIAAVRAAVQNLNRALAALVPLGIAADVSTIEHQSVKDRVATKIVGARLVRANVDINVQI